MSWCEKGMDDDCLQDRTVLDETAPRSDVDRHGHPRSPAWWLRGQRVTCFDRLGYHHCSHKRGYRHSESEYGASEEVWRSYRLLERTGNPHGCPGTDGRPRPSDDQ
jgi:hypothetical protein